MTGYLHQPSESTEHFSITLIKSAYIIKNGNQFTAVLNIRNSINRKELILSNWKLLETLPLTSVGAGSGF